MRSGGVSPDEVDAARPPRDSPQYLTQEAAEKAIWGGEDVYGMMSRSTKTCFETVEPDEDDSFVRTDRRLQTGQLKKLIA